MTRANRTFTALVLLALACGFALGAGALLAVRRRPSSVVRCDGVLRLDATGPGVWEIACEGAR